MSTHTDPAVNEFIAIDAEIIQRALRTGRGSVLRWALWIALNGSHRRGGWVLASPAVVARDFAGRPIVQAGLKSDAVRRPGCSEPTLQRQRAALLATGVETRAGKYRIPVGPRWHRVERAMIEEAIYHYPNAALRGLVALWVPLSIASARQIPYAVVPSRRLARSAHMSPSRMCGALRTLRIAGVMQDNRPGRSWDGASRRPCRVVRIVSRLAPVPGARRQTGHIITSQEPLASTPKGIDLCSPDMSGSAALKHPPAHPPCESTATLPAPPSAGAPPAAPPQARRNTAAMVRDTLARVAGVAIGRRTALALARSVPSPHDLAWFVGQAVESQRLIGIEHVGAWLSKVAAAEAGSIAARKWAPTPRPDGARPSGWDAGAALPAPDPRREARAGEAERCLARADESSGAERATWLDRAVRVARMAGGDRGRAVVVRAEQIEATPHARDVDFVRDLVQRADEHRARRLGTGPARVAELWAGSVTRARRRGAAVVLEVVDGATVEAMADHGADLAAAWRSLGGGELAITHPDTGRAVRCG